MEMHRQGERAGQVAGRPPGGDGRPHAAGAAALKKVADSAKPLFASLDEAQKRKFGLLGRAMLMPGRGHGGMMMPMHGPGGMGAARDAAIPAGALRPITGRGGL